jgi:hypothetical protein
MALVGFVMLAALAPLTDAFTSANKPELTSIIIACDLCRRLAGALSALLLLAIGFGSRLLFRP